MSQLQFIAVIVIFVVMSTLYVNLNHTQFHVGDRLPHGVLSVMTRKGNQLLTSSMADEAAAASPPLPEFPVEAEGLSEQSVEYTEKELVIYNVSGEEVVPYDDREYRAYIAKSKNTFLSHLGHKLQGEKDLALEEYMYLLSKQSECSTRPIFMSMARVSSDLYWHLIENFFHTMYYFDNLVIFVAVCLPTLTQHFINHIYVLCNVDRHVPLWCAFQMRSVWNFARKIISLVTLLNTKSLMPIRLNKLLP